MPAPAQFNEEFLFWLRVETERVWATYKSKILDTTEGSRRIGADWQTGTRWTGGLSESQITGLERRWGCTFPKDYRLFLRTLHATDRPMKGLGYTSGNSIEAIERPGFYNWLTEQGAIRNAVEGEFEGLASDVEHYLWFPKWGKRPEKTEDRWHEFRKIFESAPKLIPIFGHRFLLSDESGAGSAVLSMHHSDIIVHAANLRDYLLTEFAELFSHENFKLGADMDQIYPQLRKVPFWGDFLT
jgi:hypothetical protein